MTPSSFGPACIRPAARGAGLLAFVLAVLAGTAVRPALAQQDAGGLRVLVVDSSGAVVPRATVELTNAATNTTTTTVSDDAGYSTFSPLPRGTYTIKVSLSGFKTVDVRDLIVDVNERKFLRVELEVAAAAETVQVLATRATETQR